MLVPGTQAVLSGGQLYLATSTLVSDKSSPSYSRRPAIIWAQLSVSTATQGTDTCSQSRAGVASRQAWDFSRDFSTGWGHAVSSRTPHQDSTCLPWCSMSSAASVTNLPEAVPTTRSCHLEVSEPQAVAMRVVLCMVVGCCHRQLQALQQASELPPTAVTGLCEQLGCCRSLERPSLLLSASPS